MKDNLILHHDTLSVIKELSDEQAGQLIKEIYEYSVYINNPKEAKEPSGLNGLLNSVAHPFKMQLDRDLIKYSKVVERNAKNGQKGGRPKKEETQKKPLEPKEADSVKESDSDKGNDSKSVTIGFKKPSLSEIQSYILEKNYNVNAETFFNFYESNGWKVGKNKMKVWKASVATWNSKNNTSQPMSFKQQDQQDTRNKVEFSLENNIFDLIDEQSQQDTQRMIK